MSSSGHPPCFNSRADAELPRGKSPVCAQWPVYSGVNESRFRFVEGGVRRLVDAVSRGGRVTPGLLERIMSTRCAQRLCLRIQIIAGRVYVVAPHARRCRRGNSACSPHQRMRTAGVAMTVGLEHGKWDSSYSPTELEWHFAAGLNVSSCAGTVTSGDFNGAFRCRLIL